MTDLVLLPDVERLLSVWLRAQPEMVALVDDRVYTELPKTKEFPLVRLFRLDGADDVSVPLVFDQPVVQWDVWGGSKAMTYQVSATVRALLADRVQGWHELGVVQSVSFGGLTYLPDDEFTPAKPRYTWDTTLRTHAHPVSGS